MCKTLAATELKRKGPSSGQRQKCSFSRTMERGAV